MEKKGGEIIQGRDSRGPANHFGHDRNQILKERQGSERSHPPPPDLNAVRLLELQRYGKQGQRRSNERLSKNELPGDTSNAGDEDGGA